MKKVVLLSAFLFFSLSIVFASSSYARTHVNINFGVWPYSSYYWGYPYDSWYESWDDPWYDRWYPYHHHYYAYDVSPSYSTTYVYPSYAVSSPVSYQPVVINGTTYYVNNGVYYVYTQYGYQAIAPPAGVLQPVAPIQTPPPAETSTAAAVSSDDTIVVNIPNRKGGYTPVVIKRSGKGFVGPQGEFYSEFPKVSQLQTMYGQ